MTLLMIEITIPAYAWSNGGYSINDSVPKFGTHDYILQNAINMLPLDMKNNIDMTAAYYGSEIPDCTIGIYCIGDSIKHHVYYRADKSVQDDSSAVRAQEEYNTAKDYLTRGDKYQFSIHIGAMSHYVDDVAVFGHTMGYRTVWGKEIHHSDYETYVNTHINYSLNISFDGKFDNMSAYNGTLKLAKDTTFDEGIYTNVWMDNNYNWTDPAFFQRSKYSIIYGTNIVADVLYTLMSVHENVVAGDINGDKIITSTDALLYLKYAVGQDIYPYHIDQSNDVTCDEKITAADALMVLKKAVGQAVDLSCKVHISDQIAKMNS